MVRLPAFDIYAELGIASSADRLEIRAAYRRAAKSAHPDVADAADATGATARMARINAARDVLLDPGRRADYDRQHGLLSRRGSAGATSPRSRPGSRPGPAGTAAGGRTRRPAGPAGGARPGRRRPGDPFDDPEPPAGSADGGAANGRAASRGRRGPPLDECPICPWPPSDPYGHCALGHAEMAPRFGGPRRFRLDPAEHAYGKPFSSAADAGNHARTCAWFAATGAGGRRAAVLTGWGERAEFPAVGRIRRSDGVALDPDLVAVLAAYGDEAAVRDALAYAVAGRVVLLARYGDRVRSLVCGRHAYAVEIELGTTEARTPAAASCSCPSWRSYCKHILSTWLVWHFTGRADPG